MSILLPLNRLADLRKKDQAAVERAKKELEGFISSLKTNCLKNTMKRAPQKKKGKPF